MTASISTVSAQDALYKWDFGGAIGMSGYNGDANDGFIYRHPGFAAELVGRYNFDTRLALGAKAGWMTLSGNTADMKNVFPDELEYDFSANLFNVGVRGEFNFFPYGIGETYKRLRTWTPYVSLGIGGVFSDAGDKTYAAVQIPVSLGVKFKLQDRLNLNIELTVAKILGDKADGLSDLYTIKSSFLKNTDWYSTLSIGLTYEFGERCATCHRSN